MTSIAERLGYDPGLQGSSEDCVDEGCPYYGTPHSHPAKDDKKIITDEMVYAFHRALSDGAMNAGDVYEIRKGLYAALAHLTEWPLLDKPARVGGGRFHVGVSSRLVVEAAQRQYEYGDKDIPPTVLNIPIAVDDTLPADRVEIRQGNVVLSATDNVGFVATRDELARPIPYVESPAWLKQRMAKVPHRDKDYCVVGFVIPVKEAELIPSLALERIIGPMYGGSRGQIADLTSGTPPIERWAIYFSGYTSPDEWHNDCPPAFMEDWYLFDTEERANNECSIYNKKAFRDGLCGEKDTPYISRKVLIYPEKQL